MRVLKPIHACSGDRKKTSVSEAGCLGQEQWEGWGWSRDKTDLKALYAKVRRRAFLLGRVSPSDDRRRCSSGLTYIALSQMLWKCYWTTFFRSNLVEVSAKLLGAATGRIDGYCTAVTAGVWEAVSTSFFRSPIRTKEGTILDSSSNKGASR